MPTEPPPRPRPRPTPAASDPKVVAADTAPTTDPAPTTDSVGAGSPRRRIPRPVVLASVAKHASVRALAVRPSRRMIVPALTAAFAVAALAVALAMPNGSHDDLAAPAGAATKAPTAPGIVSAASSDASSSTPASRPTGLPRSARPGAPQVQQVIDNTPPSDLAQDGIPAVALQAYQLAATRNPACRLPWPLLAGIGRVESDHGRFAGAILHADGVSTPKIIGIPLDGQGTERISDTDDGRLDGDKTYDRAVGPMQFIPSTWAIWGADADHDGQANPFDINDAAATAADYLCAGGRDLGTAAGQRAAVLSYNHSLPYLKSVFGLEKIYAAGSFVTIPTLPEVTIPPSSTSTKPTPTARPSRPTTGAPGRPTGSGSSRPSQRPTSKPTKRPTRSPTCPTSTPTTASPTASPSASPTVAPGCPTPTASPTPTRTSSKGLLGVLPQGGQSSGA